MNIRFSYICVLLTLVCCVTALWSCGSKPSGPARIELSQEQVDLGVVNCDGDTRTKTFEVAIRNTGGADLVISQVETTCDCTTFELPDSVVEGGDSVMLKVTFDAGKYIPQDVVKEVFIHNNTSDSPKTLLFKVKVGSVQVLSDSCDTYIRFSRH